MDTGPEGRRGATNTTTPVQAGGRLFVAGLRRDGVIAPCVLDGPMTGEVFRAYVEQMLAPSLRSGDVVVMDNLPAHKVAGVREAIQAVGASLLRLPSYSPDLNPALYSTPSPQPNAATTSSMQGMSSCKSETL